MSITSPQISIPKIPSALRVHQVRDLFREGIRRSPEFEKKGLCEFGANIGAKCGHDCTYCSTGATLRTQKVFRRVGESPFATGYAIVDETTPERLARDAVRIPLARRGLVQLCTFTDAWAPEALPTRLGRRCLEAILSQPGWTVRILTKSAAVERDFDFIQRHRDRVLIGLSLTGAPDKETILNSIEPNASPIGQRLRVMELAHRLGLRTYGMLCPLLPGIGDAPAQLDFLIQFLLRCQVEAIFSEAVNPRGKGLAHTQTALLKGGFADEAAAVGRIGNRAGWSRYAVELLRNLQETLRWHDVLHRLRYLLYPSGLTPRDLAWVNAHAEGVRKLGDGTAWGQTPETKIPAESLLSPCSAAEVGGQVRHLHDADGAARLPDQA